MAKLTLYLLESSAILAFLYLFYIAALRRETLFNLSRFFLLFVLLGSLLFPFISLDLNSSGSVDQPISQLNELRGSYYDVFRELSFDRANSKTAEELAYQVEISDATSDWSLILIYAVLVIYGFGVLFCLSKVAWSIWRIRRTISGHSREKMNGFTLVKTPGSMAPFSFMNYVFVSDEMMSDSDFDQILAHEKIHVRQGHSIDLLFAQLYACFFWFNPLAWLLVSSLKTIHEYIADREMIDKGYSIADYQKLLLNQLIHSHSLGMVHNFNLSSIKKRLTMMSIPQSGFSGKVKTAFTIFGALCFSLLIVQCNATLDQKSQESTSTTDANSAADFKKFDLDDRIVIVNVGYQSRSGIADILNIINEKNPKAVGLDAFFLSPKDDVESDQKLAAALGSIENLVMVSRLDEETMKTSWSEFIEGADLGFANLSVNDKTQVEVFRPNVSVDGQNVNAFAIEMARLYNPESVTRYMDKGITKIGFSGNIKTNDSESNYRFSAIDYSEVLEGTFDEELGGKIVLLGFLGEYLGQPDAMEDKFLTMLNDSPQLEKPDMFGVVIHANIISQILDGR